jgi:hypothetical protein
MRLIPTVTKLWQKVRNSNRENRILAVNVVLLALVLLGGIVFADRLFTAKNIHIPLLPLSTVVPTPENKMVTWDAKRDGNPKTYRVGDITLALKSGFDEKNDTPLVILTVQAKNGQNTRVSSVVMGTERADADNATADFGVGKLDPGNSVNEVIFSTSSGCAHSCQEIKILTLQKDGWKILQMPRDAQGGDLSFPADINGDGIREFVLLDDRFGYDFTDYADSWMPPRVFAIRQGAVVEVTDSRKYDDLYSDMAKAQAKCVNHENGACAGYVADAARLGKFVAAWQFMLLNYDEKYDWNYPAGCNVTLVGGDCPKGEEHKFSNFPEALAGILTSYGYITVAEARISEDPDAICGDVIHQFPQIYFTSPFATDGQCYRIPMISIFQWIDSTTALVNQNMGTPLLVDFPEPPSQNLLLGWRIVRGEGAYQYQTTAGALETVPRVRLLKQAGPISFSMQPNSPHDVKSEPPNSGVATDGNGEK